MNLKNKYRIHYFRFDILAYYLWYYCHYSNPKFDQLFDKALLCNDMEQRAAYYTEMDSLMMLDAPVVVLFYDEVLRFVNKRVTNMGSNPTNLLDLRRVRIGE